MTEPLRASATIGPWTGLRVCDDDGKVLVFIDATAKSALTGIAISCLEAETLIWRVDGRDYQTQAGIPFALQILKAIQ